MPDQRERMIQSVLQQRTQNALFCLKILPILPMSRNCHEHDWIVHLTSSHALKAAVREECHIVCTDVHPDSKDIREVNWEASGKKLLVVMGNEQNGISNEVKATASLNRRTALALFRKLNFQRI